MPVKNVAFQHLCLFQSELKFPMQLLGREEGKRIGGGGGGGEMKPDAYPFCTFWRKNTSWNVE